MPKLGVQICGCTRQGLKVIPCEVATPIMNRSVCITKPRTDIINSTLTIMGTQTCSLIQQTLEGRGNRSPEVPNVQLSS